MLNIKHIKKNNENYLLYILLFGIFIVYWIINQRFTGPTYLADEIGYLTKAAALAGFPVDAASKYHGGYSLVLSPLFFLFDDPFIIWKGVLIINAMLFIASFYLLNKLLTILFPEKTYSSRLIAVLFSSLYPAWITMAGYSFATPFFVLISMIATLTLMHANCSKCTTIVPHSISIGYTYWIHPIGLSSIISSILIITYISKTNKKYKMLIIHVLIIIFLIYMYHFNIHQWINKIMTPENFNQNSYYPNLEKFYKLVNLKATAIFFIFFIGQISYLLISTIGVIAQQSSIITQKISSVFKFQHSEVGSKNQQLLLVTSFVFLSILGAVCMGSAMFSHNTLRLGKIARTDLLIYGRYTEMFLLPLLGISYLSTWRRKYYNAASLIVFSSIFFLFFIEYFINIGKSYNAVCVPSFWPHDLTNSKSTKVWFFIGAVAIYFAGRLQKKFVFILAIILFMKCISTQSNFHSNTFSTHSRPSKIVNLIRTEFKRETTIGVDPRITKSAPLIVYETPKKYSYYFFNYHYTRINPDIWASNPEGAYLTLDKNFFSNKKNVKIVAIEPKTNLLLVVNNNKAQFFSTPSEIYSDLIYNPRNESFFMSLVFYCNAKDIMKFSKVGILKNNQLVTEGKKGWLFFGPYRPMNAGDYTLVLHGQFHKTNDVRLDIVGERGKKEYFQTKLPAQAQGKNGELTFPFTLPEEVKDVEIRMFVSQNSMVSISDYTVLTRQIGHQ